MRFLTIVCLVFWGTSAMAQESKLSIARASFSECQRLLDQQQPCVALKACERGLAAKEINILKELNERASRLCELSKKPRDKPCPEGMLRGAETDGRCCWPGQVWALPAGGGAAMCVGTPTECPEGYREDAALSTCRKTCDTEGRIETVSGHCCWPGQAWSEALSSCVGFPQCPDRYEVGRVERTHAKGHTQLVEECVYSDQDGDGLYDLGENPDLCPALREDMDGFEDDDGCPEPDNDGDGICDDTWSTGSRQDQLLAANCTGSDACSELPEDVDGFRDTDGCPDLDHDDDGICEPFPDDYSLDPATSAQWGCVGVDACVDAPETLNAFEDEDGCPDLRPEEQAKARAEQVRAQAHLDHLDALQTSGWILLGAGAAFIAGGVVFLVEARDLEATISPSSDEPIAVNFDIYQNEVPSIENQVILYDTLGIAGLGLGGAAILTGATLLIIEAVSSDGVEHDEPMSSTLQPLVTPDGGWGLQLRGAF